MTNPTQTSFDASAMVKDILSGDAQELPPAGFTVITTSRRPVDIAMDGNRVAFTIGGREPIAFDRFQAEAMVAGLMHILRPGDY